MHAQGGHGGKVFYSALEDHANFFPQHEYKYLWTVLKGSVLQGNSTCILFVCLRGQNLHRATRNLEQVLPSVIPLSLNFDVDVHFTVKIQAMARQKIALKTFFFS